MYGSQIQCNRHILNDSQSHLKTQQLWSGVNEKWCIYCLTRIVQCFEKTVKTQPWLLASSVVMWCIIILLRERLDGPYRLNHHGLYVVQPWTTIFELITIRQNVIWNISNKTIVRFVYFSSWHIFLKISTPICCRLPLNDIHNPYVHFKKTTWLCRCHCVEIMITTIIK